MTGNELVYQIYEELNINSDDTTVDERLIIQLINQQRSLWVTNEYNKIGTLIDSKLLQDLPITVTERVDTILPSDGTGFGFTGQGHFIRTTLEIPRAVETKRRLLYTRVGPPDVQGLEYPVIPFSQLNYAGNGRFNKHVTHAFHYDDRLYLTSNSNDFEYIKGIHIRGVFEDPVEAASFNLPASECWTMENEYPLSERLFNFVKPQVIQQLVTRMQMPSDDTNDAADKSDPGAAPQQRSQSRQQ